MDPMEPTVPIAIALTAAVLLCVAVLVHRRARVRRRREHDRRERDRRERDRREQNATPGGDVLDVALAGSEKVEPLLDGPAELGVRPVVENVRDEPSEVITSAPAVFRLSDLGSPR